MRESVEAPSSCWFPIVSSIHFDGGWLAGLSVRHWHAKYCVDLWLLGKVRMKCRWWRADVTKQHTAEYTKLFRCQPTPHSHPRRFTYFSTAFGFNLRYTHTTHMRHVHVLRMMNRLNKQRQIDAMRRHFASLSESNRTIFAKWKCELQCVCGGFLGHPSRLSDFTKLGSSKIYIGIRWICIKFAL